MKETFTLYYYTMNGGDGSAYPIFFTTAEKRDKYIEDYENCSYFEGFCESDGEFTFSVENGKIVCEQKDWQDEEDRDLDPVWKEW